MRQAGSPRACVIRGRVYSGALLGLALALTGCIRLGFTPPHDAAADADAAPDARQDSGPDVVQGGDSADLTASDAPQDAPTWPAGGRWVATTAAPISGRLWVNAAWTGTAFAVWGGALDVKYNGSTDGALYNPVTASWTLITSQGAPSARHSSSVVWDGARVLVYGGAAGYGPIAKGGRYTVAAASWKPTSTTNSPNNRLYHAAVWTGDRMLIWGGWGSDHYGNGLLYDPLKDVWSALPSANAPSKRSFPTGVLAGKEVLIWGGCDGSMGQCPGAKGDGARYNLLTNIWKPIASTGAPSPRTQHAAVWTGKVMLVFGGCKGDQGPPEKGGAAYDPVTDAWTPLSTSGAPTDRCRHAWAWLPGLQQMVVWGGTDQTKDHTDGFLYDPVNDSWSAISAQGAPSGRARYAFAASDNCLFVWGGATIVDNTSSTGGVWCGAPAP